MLIMDPLVVFSLPDDIQPPNLKIPKCYAQSLKTALILRLEPFAVMTVISLLVVENYTLILFAGLYQSVDILYQITTLYTLRSCVVYYYI